MGTSPYNLFPPSLKLVFILEPYVQVAYLPYGRWHLGWGVVLTSGQKGLNLFLVGKFHGHFFIFCSATTFATIMQPSHVGARCFMGQVWEDVRGNPQK